MNEQPDNKIAVVTGGGSGIGRATAAKLADTGTKVICADIDEAKGAETVDQILASGGSAEFQKLNITDDDSISDFAERVMAGQPAPDVLVNAVGGCYNVLFMNADPKDWSREVDLNFLGPVKLTRAFLGPMTEAGRGKVIFVSSDAGRVGSTGESVYAGSKGGIIAFTKSLAREVARNHINVNCVCPGPTDTPLLATRPEKLKAALLKAIPFHCFADPKNIADAILFFAGDGSKYITGQVLSVSGGLTMVD